MLNDICCLHLLTWNFLCLLEEITHIFATPSLDDEEKKDFIQPFYSPSDAQKAGSCNPDIMQADEKEAFPELSR